MKTLERLFTKTDMTWRRVLWLSLLCGIVPGLLMLPAALKDTSLQQPGISYEFWIFMALLIILNCKTPLEAGKKTFVFFLISQPLIYLVQVPFSDMGWRLFSYYPLWGILTVLTFPGAMLAWYTKKGTILSALILSGANAILCVELPLFAHQMLQRFPRFLLTVVFIAFEIVFFTGLLLKRKKVRIFAFVLAALLFAFGTWYEWSITGAREKTFLTELDGSAPFEVLSEYDGVEIDVDGNELSVSVGFYCGFPIELKDADGNVFEIEFSYDENGVAWESAAP